MPLDPLYRFHLGFLSRWGGGGANETIAELRGQRLEYTFPSVKNDVVLIIWGGGGLGVCSPRMFQPLRLCLVASEQSDGENLSVISTGSPLFQVKCCKDLGCVSYHA